MHFLCAGRTESTSLAGVVKYQATKNSQINFALEDNHERAFTKSINQSERDAKYDEHTWDQYHRFEWLQVNPTEE